MTGTLGVLLIVVAVVSTVHAGRSASRDALDQSLQGKADASATALQESFERSASLNLLLANDSALREYAGANRVALGLPTPSQASTTASHALAYLQQLYPDRITAASLLDRFGTEHARAVRGVITPTAQLSYSTAQDAFLAPTLALPPGRVHQSAPYRSQQTRQWVVSSSTPVFDAAGRTWGVVHFEMPLDAFRTTALEGTPGRGGSAEIIDRAGRVLLESGQRLVHAAGSTAPPGRDLPPALRDVMDGRERRPVTVDGRRIATARVPGSTDNANTWTVMVSAPAPAAGWSGGVGPAPVAAALAALLLLAFAGLNLRSSHNEMRRISLRDELTGLPNRRMLSDRLQQALLLARRRGTSSAVLIIEVDRFKEVNDTLGHHFGDLLLCEVGKRLRSVVRSSDTVARFGGDEFAVLLPEVGGGDGAAALAERCLAELYEPYVIEGVTLSIEASIGLALAPRDGADDGAVLRAADIAMHEAKTRKSGIVAYDPQLDVHTPSRLALLGDLRRALASDELVLHYQPKVDLDTGVVRSAEALVRWQHPERGLLPPGQFIDAAEGTGLILPLTLHTLELAVAQAREWLDAGSEIQVAVNLSPRCLLEVHLPEAVQEVLARHGLPPRLLRMEITESTIMTDPGRALRILTALKDSGVALSLDDFGTGYSSMSYLKRLPVDELKIDRSFITEMLAVGSDSVLVRSSIDLGHNLGLVVVAEGVEDQQTMVALGVLGCDVVQGYHLARPMPPEALTRWLDERSAALGAPVAAQG